MSCDVDDEEEYELSYPIIHEKDLLMWSPCMTKNCF
jgi:hypothetical protein